MKKKFLVFAMGIPGAVLFIHFPALPAWANLAQSHIVQAGINLGQASARMQLFGDAFRGEPPPDQIAAVNTQLTNAAAHITAATALLEQPFSSYPWFRDSLNTVVRTIQNYGNATRNSRSSHRARYIESIWSSYRNILAVTFYSGRQDSFQFNNTCDSYMLDVGYFCGRATIASAIQPPHRRSGARASYYQSGANSALRNAVNNGLDIALDGRPRQPNPKKIACSFGDPVAWARVPNFQAESPTTAYTGICGSGDSLIPRIAHSADLDQVPPGSPICSSTRSGKTGGGSGWSGKWLCSGRGYMEIHVAGNQVSGTVNGRANEHFGANHRNGGTLSGSLSKTNLSMDWRFGDGTSTQSNSILANNGRNLVSKWIWYDRNGRVKDRGDMTCHK